MLWPCAYLLLLDEVSFCNLLIHKNCCIFLHLMVFVYKVSLLFITKCLLLCIFLEFTAYVSCLINDFCIYFKFWYNISHIIFILPRSHMKFEWNLYLNIIHIIFYRILFKYSKLYALICVKLTNLSQFYLYRIIKKSVSFFNFAREQKIELQTEFLLENIRYKRSLNDSK